MTGHLTLSRCWACQFGSHYNPAVRHTWLDMDDAEHMELTELSNAERDQRYPCACQCGGGPGVHIPLDGTPRWSL